MTTVYHPDTDYRGMVFVGAGVLDFVNGKAEADFTADPDVLARLGFTTEPPESELEKLTVADLRKHADEHDVDLGDASRKADIIKAIEG